MNRPHRLNVGPVDGRNEFPRVSAWPKMSRGHTPSFNQQIHAYGTPMRNNIKDDYSENFRRW